MLLSKSTRILTSSSFRFCSSRLPVGKGSKMTSMIKLHVIKSQKSEAELKKQTEEFEFSRRFLAKMMNKDPESFSQAEIDEAIAYLLPSGLLDPKARPFMADPAKLVSMETLECDNYGRPRSSFYYTNSPIFSSILYEGAYAIERCKKEQDLIDRGKDNELEALNYFGYNIFTKSELEEYCKKTISDADYEKFVKMVKFIENHGCGAVSKQFIDRFYTKMTEKSEEENIPEASLDPITNRMYAESYGQKKWTMVDVRVYRGGKGSITVNDKRLIEVLPKITDRETVLAPLKLIDVIGKVDIVSHSPNDTSSSLALSLRLAISRALSSLYGADVTQKLRLAGFLTQDDRFRECKMPGKPKARKSAPWVAR